MSHDLRTHLAIIRALSIWESDSSSGSPGGRDLPSCVPVVMAVLLTSNDVNRSKAIRSTGMTPATTVTTS